MTHADDLAQKAPHLKASFDDAIQAARPNLLDPVHIPDQHAHLLASYLCNMVIDRRGLYRDFQNRLLALGIPLQAEHELPKDRGYPTSNQDVVERMDVYYAKAYAMRMLDQIIGFNQRIVTIEAHLEQLRIQREQREIVEAEEARKAREGQQENAAEGHGKEERKKRPWEL